jgi:hypothetical protein
MCTTTGYAPPGQSLLTDLTPSAGLGLSKMKRLCAESSIGFEHL